MTVYASLAVTLYTMGALMLLLCAPLCVLLGGGGFAIIGLGRNFDFAPSPADYAEWVRKDASGEDGAAGDAAGTSASVPTPLKTLLSAYRAPVPCATAISYAAVISVGYSTKTLLSTMFVLIFSLSEIMSAYMSALTLLAFLVGRVVVPLYLTPMGWSPTLLMCIASFVMSLMYVAVSTVRYEQALLTLFFAGTRFCRA